MSYLDFLLSKTMLGTAAPDPDWQTAWSPLSITTLNPKVFSAATSNHAGKAVGVDEDDWNEKNPIWHFESPTFAGGRVRVENVSCKARSMKPAYMRMPVFEFIEWGRVEVRSDELKKKSLSLPLTKDFLLRSRYVKSGVIPGFNNGLWQLPAQVDQSF